eukprot:SAG31_NODE_903_length_11121_cov_10.117311_9_plen_1292_part_00
MQRTNRESITCIQNQTLLAQLKRAVSEHVRASDEHAAAAKRVESEMQTLSSRVRVLQRGYDSLETRLQDAAARGSPVLRHANAGGAGPSLSETRNAVDSVQRHCATALDNERRQTEQSIQALKDMVNNKLEIAATRTQAVCEKMLRGAEEGIARESSLRAELSREIRDVMSKVTLYNEQQDAAMGSMRRQCDQTMAEMAECAKQREDSERSLHGQQRLANLRLEEELMQKITAQTSAQIAALATQVDSLASSAHAIGNISSAQPIVRTADSATDSRVVERLDFAERECTKLKRELHGVSDSIYAMQQERRVSSSFEEQQRAVNSKMEEMVSACNSTLHAAEQRMKTEFSSHAAEHNVSRHEYGEMTKALKQLEILTQLQRADIDQILQNFSSGTLSDLQERVAIIEAESTIRRQHAQMVGSIGATDEPARARAGDGTIAGEVDASAQAILESRLAVQIRLLEEKLLRTLRDEDAGIKAKFDAVQEAVSREAEERSALTSSLHATLDERFKSLIEISTKDAVQEVSVLFQQEKIRMQDQLKHYEEWPAKLAALSDHIKRMDSTSGLPNLTHQILAECEQISNRASARVQSHLDTMQQLGTNRPLAGSSLEVALDEMSRTRADVRNIEAKVGGMEQIVRIQKEASSAIEEEVFAIRRSVPTIERIAESVRKAVSSQENVEVELLDIKERLASVGQLANQSLLTRTELANHAEQISKIENLLRGLQKCTERVQPAEEKIETLFMRLQQEERDIKSARETAEEALSKSRSLNAPDVSADMHRIERELNNLFDTVTALTAQVDARRDLTSYVDDSSRLSAAAGSAESLKSPSSTKPGMRKKVSSPVNTGQGVLDEIAKIEAKMAEKQALKSNAEHPTQQLREAVTPTDLHPAETEQSSPLSVPVVADDSPSQATRAGAISSPEATAIITSKGTNDLVTHATEREESTSSAPGHTTTAQIDSHASDLLPAAGSSFVMTEGSGADVSVLESFVDTPHRVLGATNSGDNPTTADQPYPVDAQQPSSIATHLPMQPLDTPPATNVSLANSSAQSGNMSADTSSVNIAAAEGKPAESSGTAGQDWIAQLSASIDSLEAAMKSDDTGHDVLSDDSSSHVSSPPAVTGAATAAAALLAGPTVPSGTMNANILSDDDGDDSDSDDNGVNSTVGAGTGMNGAPFAESSGDTSDAPVQAKSGAAAVDLFASDEDDDSIVPSPARTGAPGVQGAGTVNFDDDFSGDDSTLTSPVKRAPLGRNAGVGLLGPGTKRGTFGGGIDLAASLGVDAATLAAAKAADDEDEFE